MMLPRLDGWLLGPRRYRAACGLIWGLAMLALSMLPSGTTLSPHQTGREWQPQRVRLRQLLLLQQAHEAPLPPLRAFSALTLAQGGGGRLESWRADEGTLVLTLDWPALPGLFTLLAQSDVTLRGFLLEPVSPALRLTLRLEAEQ